MFFVTVAELSPSKLQPVFETQLAPLSLKRTSLILNNMSGKGAKGLAGKGAKGTMAGDKKGDKKKPISRSAKAGLQFPVGRIHRFLKVPAPRHPAPALSTHAFTRTAWVLARTAPEAVVGAAFSNPDVGRVPRLYPASTPRSHPATIARRPRPIVFDRVRSDLAAFSGERSGI